MRTVALALMAGGLLAAGGANAGFTNDFETFTLGTLTAQENWQAHSLVDVVTTTDSGLYTGGQALKTSAYSDKTFRHDEIGADFGLTRDNPDGYEYGFDFRTDGTTAFHIRMYLRRNFGSRYAPSFGFLGGQMIIRPAGESGTNLVGNAFYTSEMYGPGTAEDPGFWEKGDWLRISISLTGPNRHIATVKAYNLSRNYLEIPTGLTDVDLNGLGVSEFIDGLWTGFNFRNGTPDVFVDNAYVKDFVAPATGYDYWATTWGGATNFIGAEADDYDLDGFPNVYEYGLGGNPTDPADQGTLPVLEMVDDGGSAAGQYIHAQLSDVESGIAYFLQVNTDLVTGTWTNSGYSIAGTNVVLGTLDYVTNMVPTDIDTKSIRLIIE